MCPNSQSKDPHPEGFLDRRTLVVIMRILSLVNAEVSDLDKRIRLLWSATYQVNLSLEVIERASKFMVE